MEDSPPHDQTMASPNPQITKWKEKADAAAARARKTASAAGDKVAELRKKNAAKMREQTQQTRMSQAGAIVGAHATAVVAGQIDRELGQKRGKPGMARGINYVAGLAGAAAAIYGKSSMVRNIGAAATGMSIYQVGRDTSTYDLVPGFNGEEGA